MKDSLYFLFIYPENSESTCCLIFELTIFEIWKNNPIRWCVTENQNVWSNETGLVWNNTVSLLFPVLRTWFVIWKQCHNLINKLYVLCLYNIYWNFIYISCFAFVSICHSCLLFYITICYVNILLLIFCALQ